MQIYRIFSGGSLLPSHIVYAPVLQVVRQTVPQPPQQILASEADMSGIITGTAFLAYYFIIQ